MRSNTSQRWLLWQFIQRDVSNRFAGSLLGIAWAFINPLAQLLTYAFVFSTVLKVRPTGDGSTAFVVFLALTLWPWMAFSEAITRGSQSVVQNAALVKKTPFRHDLVVYAAVGSTYALQLLGYLLVLTWIALTRPEPLHLAGLPLVITTLLGMWMLSQGLALIAAATQVFVRDLEQALAPALAMLFYLSPILYAADQTPTWVRGVMALNPVATQVATLRDAWLGGRALPTLPDVLMVVLAAVVWALGHVVFQRLSPHFEEAL